ncbi:MAG: DNA repair protein RecO [Verrucomicrobiota bacterium]
METERAEGIVVRLQPVTETSLLVTWFTREHGKLKTLAKGARRPKSPLRGRIDLFYEDEIIFLRSRRSDLHLLHDCFLENSHRRLRESLAGLMAASYVCELVDVLTEVEDRHAAIYIALTQVLGMLEKSAGVVPLLWFELQVLAAAGWRPEFTDETGTGKVLRSLAAASATGVQRVKLTVAQARAAQVKLGRFREEQVGRGLRSEKMCFEKINR